MSILNNVKIKLCAVFLLLLTFMFSFCIVSNAASSQAGEQSSSTIYSSSSSTAKGTSTQSSSTTFGTNANASMASSTTMVSASTKTVKITGIKNMTKGIKIKWSKATGVSGYYVYRKAEGDKAYKKIKTIKGDSTLTYKDASVAGTTGTAYKYKVVPFSSYDNQKGTGTAAKIVRVDTPVIKAFARSIDKDGKTTRTISLSWKKVKKASGYRVYLYPVNGSTDDAVSYKISGADNTQWSLAVTNLHGDYRIYVKAYKKKGGKLYKSAASEEFSYSRV